jgi:hypothetical protein
MCQIFSLNPSVAIKQPQPWQVGTRTWGIQEANMGVRDILQGMKNGPRGQRRPSSSASGGRSRIMMVILGLAYKALKGSGDQDAPTDPGSPPDPGRPPRRWL